MKAFLLACVAAVVLAIIGVVVLNSIQDWLTKHSRLPRCVLVSEASVSAKRNIKTPEIQTS